MNPLGQGFYTVREAADLIEVGRLARIRGWLDGYSNSKVGPLLHRDYQNRQPGRAQELSFFDLIEVRFVEFFRARGVTARTLRAALETAREKFGEKPFATDRVRFRAAANKKIYVDETPEPIATQSEEPFLWDLANRQREMGPLMYGIIEDALEFDAKSRMAKRWLPRKKQFPLVSVNPLVACGRPAIESGITTEALYSMWKAEGQSYDAVREWFDVSIGEARQGIDFERSLQGRQSGEAA